MKRLAYFSLTIALMFSTFMSEGKAQVSHKDDWQVLFNGEDLTGWELLNGQHEVEVRDGMIIGTAVTGLPNGFVTYTEEEFGDFILELEVKADLQIHNSGIQFRSLSTDEYRDGRVHGYQAEVNITPQRWSGGIYDEARRGWLYILEGDNPAREAFKNNQWNHYRIEAFGTMNRIWVNGIPTSHLVDDMTTEGLIALQIHGNVRPQMPQTNHDVYFRNIRIKTENIEPSPYDDIFVMNLIPNTVSGQEEHQGFSLLWNGQDLDGWQGSDGSEVSANGLQIENGVLTIDSGDENVILTADQYGPFELKFDFMQHQEYGEPGIGYLVQKAIESNSPSTSGTYGQLTARQADDVGEWNKGVIKVLPDGVVQYWLNGYEILEYYLNPDKSIKGQIRLVGTDSAISYRSIKLRPLN